MYQGYDVIWILIGSGVTDVTSRENLVNQTLCSLEAFISVATGGRLGNHIQEYANLIAFSRKLGLKPFISKSMKESLSTIFS